MTELLTVKNLQVITKKRAIPIVKGVSFNVERGEVFAIVGESGSGKSITTQSIAGMQAGNLNLNAEQIQFNNQDLQKIKNKDWLNIRGHQLGMIFQDPMTSLNPTLTIGKQLMEIFIIKKKYSRKAARDEAIRLLKSVEITLPEARLKQYPHELSGGMRQRIVIAMALALSPDLVIADEPTTALDVTTQKQILSLLQKLKEEKGSAILLITHDLGVVAEIADRVAVMYSGKIVEQGSVEAIFNHPKHPYTAGLLASLIKEDTDRSQPLYSIKGRPSMADEIPQGCPFVDRCPYAMNICVSHYPATTHKQDHQVDCWLEEVRT